MINIVKIYLSGPITSIGETEAKKRFKEADDIVRDNFFIQKKFESWLNCECKIVPINPMELTHNHDKTHESFMKEDLEWLEKCEGIVFLKGFEKSVGAKMEFYQSKDKVCYLIGPNGSEDDIMHCNWLWIKNFYNL